jgi:hypoxanthine phosphoribosyltransferase
MDVTALQGQHVLIVEDIIDTGLTMTKLIAKLERDIHPASVRVAALLEKRTHLSNGFKGDYVAFSVPDKFIVGYGLDYNEVFRDLGHIAVISQAGIEKYRQVKRK